jgi:hypothetical protein
MVNYQEGRVYRLVCNVTGLVYIGSTTQPLYKRKHGHAKDYRLWKDGLMNYVTSFKIIENGDYEIFLIEDCPCDSKEQLMRRERHWIENTTCVNKHVPTRTDKEWRETNADQIKEKQRQYYEANADQLKEQARQYRKDNVEQIKEIRKRYYEANADQIKEDKRQYYKENVNRIKARNDLYRQANADRIKEKKRQYYELNADRIREKNNETVTCPCGSSVKKRVINRHERSKKHQEWLQNKQESGNSSTEA